MCVCVLSCFVFSCRAVHFGKEILISCVCVCVCLVGSHQPNLDLLLITLSHCKLLTPAVIGAGRVQLPWRQGSAVRGSARHSTMAWLLPSGGQKEVRTEEPACRDLGRPVGCWRVPGLRAELVFVVSRERRGLLFW